MHPNQIEDTNSGSHTWHSMLKVRDVMEINTFWDLNDGSASFFWDNWSGKGYLGASAGISDNFQPQWKVVDFLNGDEWNLQKLNIFFPYTFIANISETNFCRDTKNKDRMIWMPHTSGAFSVGSAYKVIRAPKTPSTLNRFIWAK